MSEAGVTAAPSKAKMMSPGSSHFTLEGGVVTRLLTRTPVSAGSRSRGLCSAGTGATAAPRDALRGRPSARARGREHAQTSEEHADTRPPRPAHGKSSFVSIRPVSSMDSTPARHVDRVRKRLESRGTLLPAPLLVARTTTNAVKSGLGAGRCVGQASLGRAPTVGWQPHDLCTWGAAAQRGRNLEVD